MGILPGVAAWGCLLAKTGLRAAGVGSPGGPPLTEAFIGIFQRSDTFIAGAFALEQGFIFTSMLLGAATVYVIERRFVRAGLWCLGGSIMSLIGLMHSYRFTGADTVINVPTPAWPFVIGYAGMAVCFILARFITIPTDDPGH
jgi:AGZA family xanthine/uracil permease-like MFS transporter